MTNPWQDPPHYADREPQPFDVIESWGLTYALGNVVKYIARAPYKGTQLADLHKAAWYLAREIARLEKAEAHD